MTDRGSSFRDRDAAARIGRRPRRLLAASAAAREGGDHCGYEQPATERHTAFTLET